MFYLVTILHINIEIQEKNIIFSLIVLLNLTAKNAAMTLYYFVLEI